METNKFELIGIVNYIDTKAAAEKGILYTRILLSRRVREGVYESIPIVFFDEAADNAGENIKKKDRVYVTGRIVSKELETDNGKKRITIDLIGNDCRKVEYSEAEHKYVEAEPKLGEEEIPW